MYKTFEAEAAAQHSRYMKKKEMHICVDCNKQDKRTLQGLTRCAECYEKQKVKARERSKTYYKERKSQNVCVYCGNKDAYTINGRSACSECAEKNAEYKRKKYGYQLRDLLSCHKLTNISAYERQSYNLCYFCGEQIANRYKINGDKVHTCEKCYQRCQNLIKNARERKKKLNDVP